MSERIEAQPLVPLSLRRRMKRVSETRIEHIDDAVSIEEPLEIRLAFGDEGARQEQSIAITMRTPGADESLAVGFLAGEAIIRDATAVRRVEHCGPPSPDKGIHNTLRVELDSSVRVDLEVLKRHFYTTSSCGVCGKASLEAIALQVPDRAGSGFAVSADVLTGLGQTLAARQDEFARTGGLHAAASFDSSGEIERLAEDIGRHNALDKLVGSYLSEGGLAHLGVLLSGRASFELIQKAAMAGVRLVAAIGAPSSLAIELAEQQDVTLVGFLKSSGFNIYCHAQRVRQAR